MKFSALTQMKANNLKTRKHADGQGRWLIERDKNAGRWMLRLMVYGKRAP